MKIDNIKVTGMSCSHCESRVNTALIAMKGVNECKSLAKENLVTVSYDPAEINIDAIKNSIVSLGYSVL